VPGKADRAVEKLDPLPQSAARPLLAGIAAGETGCIDEQHGITYVYRERRGETYPAREEFYVAAPAVIETKARHGIAWFDGRWNQHDLFVSAD
jgi:hypothetical protein